MQRGVPARRPVQRMLGCFLEGPMLRNWYLLRMTNMLRAAALNLIDSEFLSVTKKSEIDAMSQNSICLKSVDLNAIPW